ncbi:MAG: FadR family transcriptional regulator [Deltaproteobacteria bacterium]|nr:FadR family transcriptional regulator [Deltaproteobacteria bacterium]
MLDMIKPVRTESLKAVCIRRFEELILSGKLPVGKKLPPERELAVQLGVSRPVVHEALVEIAAKGLVSMIPRIGTVVNDYRREGSVAILTSLISYHNGMLDPKLLESLLAMRMLMEKENAKLAASNRTSEQMLQFKEILKQEEKVDHKNIAQITEIDFDFHHLVAMATDNLSYPMLLNSFRPVYTSMSGQFFQDPDVIPEVFSFHKEMVDALEKKDGVKSVDVMHRMRIHGEERLREIISK